MRRAGRCRFFLRHAVKVDPDGPRFGLHVNHARLFETVLFPTITIAGGQQDDERGRYQESQGEKRQDGFAEEGGHGIDRVVRDTWHGTRYM